MLSHAASHIDSSRPAISSRRASPAQNPDVGGVPKQHPLIDAMHMMGATMSFPSETEIFGEGEAADYAYQVISGGVRTYKILRDGRRQVAGFYLPGDIFGLDFQRRPYRFGRSDHRHEGCCGQAQYADDACRSRPSDRS